MTEIALVTGAGSGIGREFVRLLLADGVPVLAVSLLQEELDRLAPDLQPAPGQLLTLRMDLAEPDAAERLLDWCRDRGLVVGTLVNNAGFACYGEAVSLSPARVASMIALNVTTLTKLAMLVGAEMKARGGGRILNVGSTAGLTPFPEMAAYSATKAYVNSFSVTLDAELRPHGVTVTCLAPGATATGFARAGGILDFAGPSRMKALFVEGKAGGPEVVARAGYRALRQGRNFVLAGTLAWAANLASRLVPLRMIPGILRRYG
jgi:short-subunit dehydrogenase